MRENVTVVKTQGKNALVRLEKKSECDKCGMCVFPKNAQSAEISARNLAGAEEGDLVVMEREKDGRLLGAFLVFLVPLLLIGAAAVIALLVIKKEIWILFLSLIFLFLWYTILAFIDKKLQSLSSFAPKIVEIVQKGDKDVQRDKQQDRI